MSDSVRPHRRQPTRLPHPWDSLGKNTGVGCHFLLQGIFLTQGLNLGLLNCRRIFLPFFSHHRTRQVLLHITLPPTSSKKTTDLAYFHFCKSGVGVAHRLIKLQGIELKSHQESKAAEDLTVAGRSPQKRFVCTLIAGGFGFLHGAA